MQKTVQPSSSRKEVSSNDASAQALIRAVVAVFLLHLIPVFFLLLLGVLYCYHGCNRWVELWAGSEKFEGHCCLKANMYSTCTWPMGCLPYVPLASVPNRWAFTPHENSSAPMS